MLVHSQHRPHTLPLVKHAARHASGGLASAPQFSGEQQHRPQTDEQALVALPAKRGWVKTLLLGMGAVVGLYLMGRRAIKTFGNMAVAKVAGRTAQQTASSAPGMLSSLVATGGGWLLSILRSELAIGLIVAGAKAVSLKSPAFKLVTDKVTTDNVQKLLNPEFIQGALHEIAEHKLHSPQAIRDYISHNTGDIAKQISSLTGFSEQNVRETLESIAHAFGNTAA